MKSGKEGEAAELRVGSDKGILYFSLKGENASITTGLAAPEAAIANSLLSRAERKRLSMLI